MWFLDDFLLEDDYNNHADHAQNAKDDADNSTYADGLFDGEAVFRRVADKVKLGLNESRQKGLFTGGPLSYGYKITNKRVVIDEEKANAVRHIFNRYAAGAQVPTIIEELTKASFYNHDKPFAKTTVLCGKCGKPITMESGTARNGEVQRYYKCSGKKRRINTCTLKPLGKESFEKYILAVVLNVVKNETIDIIASHIVA